MQILVDARLLSRGGNSGVEEYTRGLLSELFQQGQSDTFTLFYNGLNKVALESQLPIAGRSNVRVLDLKIPNKIFDFSSRFLNRPFINRLSKADLIFSPHFNNLAWQGVPRIVTIPDLSFIHHPQFFSWRHRFWNWLQNVKRQAQLSDKIVTVSEFTKSDIVDLLGVAPEKVSVIYPGISKIFRPMTESRPGRPYILYLGTIEPRKNIALLIRAFNVLKQEPHFKDWQLIIAGRLGWLYDQVLREAKNSPFSEDIIFRGAVESQERVSLYNLARVFVYPSFFEGFGFPPLEAQAVGCPVIVSDRTSLPEVLGATALYVNPWKVMDLVDSIKRLDQDDSLRSKMITGGIENSGKFDWKNSAEQTLKLFHAR
ncbi:MAG: glycosyltransferase family 1 protein [bacterium]|nr:glycosyltransferase family 1 protein [bacterium]